MSSNYSIKKIISLIKTELINDYPLPEIESFMVLIMEHIFDYSRTQIHLHQEKEVSSNHYKEIIDIIDKLKNYQPIQYILGSTEFYGLKFFVNKSVLIPRQETEELVDWIIKNNKTHSPNILDIGTGSGCIAVSLAKSIPESKVTALDISEKALKIASENSRINSVSVDFMNYNILDKKKSFSKQFDIIVSNPPYVTESEKTFMHLNVLNFEPHIALFVSDENPLKFYKAITHFAKNHLTANGKLYFEINEAYGNDVADLLISNNFTDVVLKKDLNKKDRMVCGTLNKLL